MDGSHCIPAGRCFFDSASAEGLVNIFKRTRSFLIKLLWLGDKNRPGENKKEELQFLGGSNFIPFATSVLVELRC